MKMKELHNQLFSDTICISQEMILKLINKQLSKKELHEIETHILDCELCTDAYEGMAYAENSSMLFAINSQIDKKTGKRNVKTLIMQNLMVAASVLAIILGAYFTFTFFNETVNKKQNLALNTVATVTQKQQQLESMMSHSTGSVNMEKIDRINKTNKIKNSTAQLIITKPFLVNKNVDNKRVDKVAKVAEVKNDMIIVEKVEHFEEKITAKKTGLKPVGYASISANKVMQEPTVILKSNKQNRLTIKDSKGVDILNENQELDDAENDMELSVVSTDFERKLNAEITENEEIMVEITDKEILKNAINLYKNKAYKAALFEFDMILTTKQTAFNEETNWYKALTLIKMNAITKAKKLLQSIVKKDGVYKNKAEKKLKQL